MSKMLEFDTFMQEAQDEKLTVVIGGKPYQVPPKIPAIVPLMMARAEKLADQGARNAAQGKMIFAAADALFGETQMDAICESGMSVERLTLLVQKTFELINGAGEADDSDVQEFSDEDSRSRLPGDAGKK